MKEKLDAINKRRRDWIAVVNAGNVDRCAALLTDDAVWLPPGMAAIRGKRAIHEWLERFFDKFDYEFSISEEK